MDGFQDGKGLPGTWPALPSRPHTDKMFENLNDKLERAFKVLKGQGQITEINVAETVKEIRRALLDADVNYKTAKDFTGFKLKLAAL